MIDFPKYFEKNYVLFFVHFRKEKSWHDTLLYPNNWNAIWFPAMNYVTCSDMEPVGPSLCLCHYRQACIQLRWVSLVWRHNPRLVEWSKNMDVQKDNFLLLCLPWYNLEDTRLCWDHFCCHCKGVWWRCVSKIRPRNHGVWFSFTNVYHFSYTCIAQSVQFCLWYKEGGCGYSN